MENIWKRFPGVVALKGVTIDVKRGEILGLVGENGAGKSTLLKILFGVYKADEGRIVWKGREVEVKNPYHAMTLGISYVPQETLLSPNLSIAENIFLGFRLRKGFS
ncbi:MAG: D-xylose ABC transporter ATP-binding protein, partial [Thermoprotei archaeon]